MSIRDELEKLVEGKYNYTDPRVKKRKINIATQAILAEFDKKIDECVVVYSDSTHEAMIRKLDIKAKLEKE